jgi:hypothetical protein
MNMKKAFLFAGILLLLALVAAGSFWGGMRYASIQANQVRDRFMNARGQTNGGPFPGEGQFSGGEMPSAFPEGGGTTGEVKTVNGDVITVSTAQDVTTVQLTGETRIGKSITVNLQELQPGIRVRIIGQRDNAGRITADQITILSDEFEGFPSEGEPSKTGTEP